MTIQEKKLQKMLEIKYQLMYIICFALLFILQAYFSSKGKISYNMVLCSYTLLHVCENRDDNLSQEVRKICITIPQKSYKSSNISFGTKGNMHIFLRSSDKEFTEG